MKVAAPLSGWALALSEVPDEVFAASMAGDGVAIDPTSDIVCAPFDGEVVPVGDARHAVTVRSAEGIEVLVHVGIDTVALQGRGFEMLAKAGDRVTVGTPLLRFDLDAVARAARSLVTPVILSGAGTITNRTLHRLVSAGESLFDVDAPVAAVARGDAHSVAASAHAKLRVPFDHGLHVRPAALIAAALKPFAAQVEISMRGRSANARSGVALMALGARCGDTVDARAYGTDADAAIEALSALLGRAEPAATVASPRAPVKAGRIEAVIASRGVCVGVAARLVQRDEPVAEQGSGVAAETRALEAALDRLQAHLVSLARAAEGTRKELLQAHAELVRDPDLHARAMDLVRAGKSAGHAWRSATRAVAEMLASLEDARMNERAADLRDLEGQLLRVLRGAAPSSARELPPRSVVVADDLLPSQFIAFEPARLAGIVLARGGATSHVSILAASSAIPMLVASGSSVLDIAEGTAVIVDAERGWIDVDPPAGDLAAAATAATRRSAERAADLSRAHEPAVTLDGVRIVVNANAGSVADARVAMENGADGCGLLRTEFLFLERRDAPGEDEQAGEYARIAKAFEGRSVNVRTLDIGGDKPIAYLALAHEDNPALGLRGVRTSLAHPHLLRVQLAAIVRAAATAPCRILVPMVNELDELFAVRDMARACASEAGIAMPALGIMVETPAAALGARSLAAHCDFLSIGSNDLAQYALAIDRGHADLARRLDALHPAVLRLIAATVEGAGAHGRSVSVCGAMASDVEALPLLIGLGVREISATPAAIPRLKRIARLLDTRVCGELARRALGAESAAAVRELASNDPSGGPR